MYTFQFSPKVADDSGSASKVFTTFVDLSVSGIWDLNSSSLVIHFVNLNPPLQGMFDILIDVDCFLRISY